MSVFVWVMMGIAIWHACVLVPDRFYGGIIGAFLAAVAGALATGYLLPTPGLPPHNPPGIAAALWPVPGTLAALVLLYRYGVYRERIDAQARLGDRSARARAKQSRRPGPTAQRLRP